MNGRNAKIIRKKLKHEYKHFISSILECSFRSRIRIVISILRKKDFTKYL